MKKNKFVISIAVGIFLVFFAFWLVVAITGVQGNHPLAEKYSALYGLMALYGGIVGLAVSRHWGGFRSKIGRAVTLISLGLLAQEVGQLTYSGYTYIAHQEIPYPSLGDIGYFGSVILYIWAALVLIKALSTKSTLRQRQNQLWLVIIPLAILSLSYYIFLRGYHFDFNHPVTILLDFGYPLGQALYLSLATVALIFSSRYLGGIMKPVILFLLFALLVQYISDFTFLYQVSRNTWKTAGPNELSYLVGYFVMTIALINFQVALNKMKALTGPAPPATEEQG
jgi:hypothetical protein